MHKKTQYTIFMSQINFGQNLKKNHTIMKSTLFIVIDRIPNFFGNYIILFFDCLI